MSALPDRPVCILIAALGGEGGGVLADWLVDAASHEDYPVQSTSIPGVSQRTGATTYYVEIYPARRTDLGGREPVLALTPSPGCIDLMAASELIEAGRAIQNGYVSPERSTLVASTHRVFATAEKILPGDGRYDAEAVTRAAGASAARVLLFDLAQIARQAGTVINAVLFGVMAGSGALPLTREACEAAIRRAGKGAEASLAGFAAGFALAAGSAAEPALEAAAPAAVLPAAFALRVTKTFPAALQPTLALALPRLVDFQDAAYAGLYLDRLEGLVQAGGDEALLTEAARRLAVWMCFEDVIRVAQLKTRRERFERVRREVGAGAGEPVAVIDYFKPGLEERADLLPPAWAARLRAKAAARGGARPMGGGWQLRSSAIGGFLLLRAVAALRRWRRRGARYAEEQAAIERWLGAVRRHAAGTPQAALEIARLAGLIKGYSDTHRRGRASFERIFADVVEAATTAEGLAERIRQAHAAARADAGGKALDEVLAGRPAPAAARVQTIAFMPRPKKASSG